MWLKSEQYDFKLAGVNTQRSDDSTDSYLVKTSTSTDVTGSAMYVFARADNTGGRSCRERQNGSHMLLRGHFIVLLVVTVAIEYQTEC